MHNYGIRALLRNLWAVMAHDKMPVWMSIVGLLVGVIFTYKVAPYVNAQFETAKMQSTYILDTLKSLNAETSGLFAEIGKINRFNAEKQKIKPEDIEPALQIISKLHWRVVEYRVVFHGEDAKNTINSYVSALSKVRESIEYARTEKNSSDLSESVKIWTEQSAALIQMIVRNSKISVSSSS